MKRENVQEYQKLFQDVRRILNQIDPEQLSPGAISGAPVNEYDAEVALILSYVIHNQEAIKINKDLLVNQINMIWEESFGGPCKEAISIASALLKVLF